MPGLRSVSSCIDIYWFWKPESLGKNSSTHGASIIMKVFFVVVVVLSVEGSAF